MIFFRILLITVPMAIFYYKDRINHNWMIIDLIIVICLNIFYIGGAASSISEFPIDEIGNQLRLGAISISGLAIILSIFVTVKFFLERRNNYIVDNSTVCIICI